jgi:hypothetical protein
MHFILYIKDAPPPLPKSLSNQIYVKVAPSELVSPHFKIKGIGRNVYNTD